MRRTFIFMAMMMVTFLAHAFDFDGIDLNDNYTKVTQEISKRGYIYDNEKECLKGNCQGTEIYLSFNLNNVSTEGKVGQLIVEIPNGNAAQAYTDNMQMFNVIYHQVSKDANSCTYAVSEDGTQLVLSKKDGAIVLTYNTPYYKK